MSEHKAVLLPQEDEIPRLFTSILFGDGKDRESFDFCVISDDQDVGLEEVTLKPLTRVCAGNNVYTITGYKKELGILATVSVDLGQVPPVATYVEHGDKPTPEA